jgi:glycosyltransferase involved in cell wall biosynthesis
MLFFDTPFKVLTVYLTGVPSEEVVQQSASDEVVFLNYKSSEVSGLKLDAIRKVKKIVSNEKFLCCIAHRAKPTYIALLATKLPVISVHHNYNDFSRFSRRVLVNFYQSRILMLGVSNAVSDDIRRDLKGWDQARIQTLYNRIDVKATQDTMLNKPDARVALHIPQNAWVIGNVGRLHYDKDQTTLISGFAKALPYLPKNSILVLMGSGPLEQDLKRLAEQLGLSQNIMFTGQVLDAKRYFRAFDMFVLTSDREPFGMVLLEAMAAELPIICSDNGGGAEVVNGVGELFLFGDSDLLSEKLIKVSEQQQMSKTTKTPLKRLTKHFSDEAVRKHFWQLSFVVNLVNNQH